MQKHSGIKIWNLMHELFKLQKSSYQLPTLTELETRVLYMTFMLHKKGNKQINVSAIKTLLNVSHPTISQTVTRLEHGGYLIRTKDQKDKRVTIISLSEKGKTTLQQSFDIVNQAFIDMANHLGEDKSNQFIAILEEMITYFKERGGTK